MASLYLIAGPYGSGKSTFGKILNRENLDVFDFHRRYYELHGNLGKIDQTKYADVQDIFLKEVKERLRLQQSFAYETNFASRYNMQIPDKFKEYGFKLELLYLAVERPEDSLFRIREKNRETGIELSVGHKEVAENQRLSARYVMESKDKFDKFVLIDNSPDQIPKVPKIILEQEKSNTIYIDSKVPRWMVGQFDQIKELKLSPSKKRDLGF